MGLDMHMRAKLYISGHRYSEEAPVFNQIIMHLPEFEVFQPALASLDRKSLIVAVTVGYWYNASAIHNWFVENVQDGKDDCGEYYVNPENLGRLRDVCREVLATVSISAGQPVVTGVSYYPEGRTEAHFTSGRVALNGEELSNILPTTSGVFYGTTPYDEWYLQSVEYTLDLIETKLLPISETFDLYYNSSW